MIDYKMLSFKFSCDKTVIYLEFLNSIRCHLFLTLGFVIHTNKNQFHIKYISSSYHKSENLKFKFFFILQQPANKMSISFNTSK